MRLGVSGAILRYAGEDGLCVVAHDGKLNQIRRIEHHVSILLVWIDPLLFGSDDVRPLFDGLTGRKSTFIIITNDTT